MTINERIKYLRTIILKLNQKDFAASLGMAQTGISTAEKEGATITEKLIKLISSVYNVNEIWIREGIEPILKEPSAFSLDEYVKEKKMTDLELSILKTYFELDPNTRKAALEHFKNNLLKKQGPTLEELEDEYKKKNCSSALTTTSSASSSTEDTEFGKTGND